MARLPSPVILAHVATPYSSDCCERDRVVFENIPIARILDWHTLLDLNQGL